MKMNTNTENTVNNEVATAAPEEAQAVDNKVMTIKVEGAFAIKADTLRDMVPWMNDITRTSGKTLPVLSSILFCKVTGELDGAAHYAMATNLDETLFYDLTGTGEFSKFGVGMVAISIADMKSIVAMHPAQGSELKVSYVISRTGDEKFYDVMVDIRVDIGGVEVCYNPLMAYPPCEFPSANMDKLVSGKQKDIGEAASAYVKAAKCISSDETRRILAGVCFDTVEGSVTATDGRMLYTCSGFSRSLANNPDRKGEKAYTVRVTKTSIKLMSSEGVAHYAFFTDEKGWFAMRCSKHPGVLYTFKLIDGVYPNYKQVIPGAGKDDYDCGVLLTPEDVAILNKIMPNPKPCGHSLSINLQEGGKVSFRSYGKDMAGVTVVLPKGEWWQNKPVVPYEPPADGSVAQDPRKGPPFTTVAPVYFLRMLNDYGMSRIYIHNAHNPIYAENLADGKDGERIVLMPLRIS